MPSSSSVKHILFRNASLIDRTTDASKLLHNFPRGAYTTMRTLHHNRKWAIFQYGSHLKRMHESCAVLNMDSKAIDKMMLDSLAVSMKQFLEENGTQDELKITVLACEEGEKKELVIYTHITILPDRPSGEISVDIRRGSRVEIKGKDTIWVQLREGIMNRKTPKSNEALLCEEDGNVREGCSSNFFVVKDKKLYTAKEGILEGTVQQLVYAVCAEIGIEVVYEVPSITTVGDWDECFITSTSRLVLPIQTLIIPEECQDFIKGNESASKVLKEVPEHLLGNCTTAKDKAVIFNSSPLSQKLLDLVRHKMVEMSTDIIEYPEEPSKI